MKLKLTTGKTLDIQQGETILDTLKRHEIYLVASCGGKGTCGKCKVRATNGDPGASGYGNLTSKERDDGTVLACLCTPSGDLTIEVPESSRLVIGDKIAVARAESLQSLMEEMGATLNPVLETIELHLPPPTLHDNISDIERLRRALDEHDINGVHFSHGFVTRMADALRSHEWKVNLGYTQHGAAPEAVFIAPADDNNRYGIAVDIGTTTVVVYLVDLVNGHLLDVGLTYNSQMRWGDDVITRIVHTTEGGGLDELRRAVVTDINDLIRAMLDRHGIKRESVESACISGNTTMSQLFWGLNPGYIREEPYIPTLNSFPMWQAGTARLRIHPEAPVYTLPCVASYVGGDIVSGVLASKMHRSEEIALFMDIGTNGEIALGNNEWLVTAAASAGPCFEGSGIRSGMRATEGAIEDVKINRETLEPELTVIGEGPPVGICGSGMIDAISEMFITGIVDQKGTFTESRTDRIREGQDGPEYVFFEDGTNVIVLTQVDIENILRAKAAIYAAVTLLAAEVGFTLADIQRVYIAGGFGNYLDVEKAVILGMLPDLPADRFEFLGNTSVAGAYLSLLSEDMRKEAESIASQMTYIELSVSRGFMDEYMSAMFLPHTDMRQFPTVTKLLESRKG